MSNVIPPLNTPQISTPTTDKPITGSIENLGGQLGGESITIGQSAMLEVLSSAKQNALKNFSGTISLTINNQLIKIPVELKLDTPIKLPSALPTDNLELKLQPQKDGTIAVKLVSVNNENPTKFIVPQAENLPKGEMAQAIIKDTNAKLPPMEATPLRAENVLEKMATELKIPQAKIQPLLQEFANLSSRVSVRLQLQQTLETSEPNLKPLVVNIQNILRSFGEGKINLQEAIGQIKTELSGLKGQTFVVPSEVRPDNGMVLLKTPLAELPLNNPPKLGNGLPLLLEIEGFEEVLPKVTEALTEQTAVTHNVAKNTVPDNIMKILKPLISSGQQELAAAVLNKIPEPSSPKMLANMVSYIKAGSEHNLSKWLGAEIVDKLSATKEGREVVAKLGTMFVSSNQDGINWRIMEVPVLNGQTINKIRIAVKKILDEEEKKKRKENRLYGTRFVVDTNFSRLGSFQFDGFALVKDKRFDLIIRTEREIDSDFCANIMRLFKNTLYEEGYSGNVKINVKEKFIKICEDNAENEILADGIYI